jgi:tRNA threonylcarbamoyladenosine biosynthesis protein TsaB
MTASSSAWLLALESSTPHGGSALIKDGVPLDTYLREEGLRHGRELTASAETLLKGQNLRVSDLKGLAVSIGPGSYTGIRVGVMAAKAMAWAAGVPLAAVSSLAALAQTAVVGGHAGEGDRVYVVQDARRDEVYAGLYRITDGLAVPLREDADVTPEEAAGEQAALAAEAPGLVRAGSSFATYRSVLGEHDALPGRVDPGAVGLLGWRRIMQEETADPLLLQPVYLRRDTNADWRHDHLIA